MKQPPSPQSRKIQAYIAMLDKTLDVVFLVPKDRRNRIIASLRRKDDKDYWDVALHYLPLYTAANLASVQICYPDFDKYEELYAQLIEGRGANKAAATGDD